jgi:hypothetical protein
MGLFVQVGVLASRVSANPEGAAALRTAFRHVNDLLARNTLPAHDEPEALPPVRSRAPAMGYPYSFLHYLRRVAAYALDDPAWVATPLREGEDPARDPTLDARSDCFDSHLIFHSDSEGFYLPLDFTRILVGDDDAIPGGGIVGSSPALLRELTRIAPALDIRLSGPELTDGEIGRLKAVIAGDTGLYREIIVWLSLFEAARLSIEHRAAVYFT